jgi:uncharacterized protein involved in exopolysaccharide biosynthesis
MSLKGGIEMRFLAKLLQHWYLYLIPVLTLPVLVGIYGLRSQQVYESSALLYIQDNSQVTGINISGFSQYASPAQNVSNAMNELLQSETFVVTVASGCPDLANAYDLTTRGGQDAVAARLTADIGISPSAVGTSTVVVLADDKSPKVAQEVVLSMITTFSSYFATQRLALDTKSEQFLLKEVNDAKTQVAQDAQRIQQYEDAHPGTPVDRNLDPTLAQLIQQHDQDAAAEQALSEKLTTVQFDIAAAKQGNSDLYTVLDQPQLPLRSTQHLKKLLVYPLAGLGGALALIVLVVGLRTLMDRRVYTTRDLRVIAEDLELEISSLLTVPLLEGDERNGHVDPNDPLSGVLVPVLAVLPQQDGEQINHEIRRAVGVTVDDEA